MTDYDMNLRYHPGKISVVPDALSRKLMAMFLTQQKELLEEMRLAFEGIMPGSEMQFMTLQLQSSLIGKIKHCQKDDPKLQKFRSKGKSGRWSSLNIHTDRSIRFKNRHCMPKGDVGEVL